MAAARTGVPGDESQRGRNPQEQRQRMRDLLDDLLRPLPPTTPDELVSPVCHQPPVRFATRQPVEAGSR